MSLLMLAVNGCVFAPIASRGRKNCEQRLRPYAGRWSKCIPEYRKTRKTHSNLLTYERLADKTWEGTLMHFAGEDKLRLHRNAVAIMLWIVSG